MRSASRWSWCDAPTVASMTSRATSARSRARRARMVACCSVPRSVLDGRRRPAVSMKRTGPSVVSTTVSMASRVVPGMSCTMARSSPRSLLKRVDLPTLGRPMMATLGVPGSRSPLALSAAAGGQRSASSLRRAAGPAAVPPPRRAGRRCPARAGRSPGRVAEARGRRTPRWPASRLASSTLLTTSRTGGPARRITLAAARSSSVTPVVTSTTIRITSASARARSAWSLTLASRASPPASQPPVSMMEKGTPDHSAESSLRSRVTPCSSSTTAARGPTMRFTSEDLPTLGRPATTTIGLMPRTRAGTRCRRGPGAARPRPSAPPRPAGAGRPGSARRGSGPR